MTKAVNQAVFRENMAVALLLWRDFVGGDDNTAMAMLAYANQIGCEDELSRTMAKLPPMKIEPRYPASSGHDTACPSLDTPSEDRLAI